MNDSERMPYRQRELLKAKAWPITHDTSKSIEERADALLMIIEAHYHRNPSAPSFSEYACHWLWANDEERLAELVAFLTKCYPPPKKPRIQRGYSDWGSFGDPSYQLHNR